MSPAVSSEELTAAATTLRPGTATQGVMAAAAWTSLLWLVIANAVGVLLAAMLLVPQINTALGEWTYGRWMPVHLNLQLYGWCSLPLVAFLLRVYKADRAPAGTWARASLWLWSAALAAGSISWLEGHTSGKLFLDWTGYVRVLFPLALLALWALLACSFAAHRRDASSTMLHTGMKALGLALLLAVPMILYVAASPAIYPPINPDTGGPTGASQLESTLIILALLLLLPYGLVQRTSAKSSIVRVAWVIFAMEALLCLALGRADVSHHRPVQWISLGSLLVWIPLTPAYYAAFRWHANTRAWRLAFLGWWSILVPTGWMLFLPGVLDRFKFTDGLVGHSLLAMAGFASSLLIFVLTELLGDEGWIFNTRWSFVTWHVSVLLYVAIMFYAGWMEGTHPSFSFLPGPLRNGIYAGRLLLGILMLAASADWLYWASGILRRPSAAVTFAEAQ